MRALLIILSNNDREPWANEVIQAAQAQQHIVVVGSPADAAHHIVSSGVSPSHVLLDIGSRGREVLEEIDTLAQQCEPGTNVVVVGDANDIVLYREILARGILEYIPMPAAASDLVRALNKVPTTATHGAATKPEASSADKRVIVFMSAASGDGASTIALNTAYAISQQATGNTVLVDMDYQFGMVAKHLALQNQYGIRDLFDHPERGVDATLIKRMVASYGRLHVVTAPAELRYLPNVNADAIRQLIQTLKLSYDTIIIDLPHVWLPWVATAAQQSTHMVIVAQLWLKSVSHAARLMRALRDLGVSSERVVAIINRSGAKFKEAIDPKDFERVCNTHIRHAITNDIKSVVAAETAAKTMMELNPSQVTEDIQNLARGLLGLPPLEAAPKRSGGLLAKLKG